MNNFFISPAGELYYLPEVPEKKPLLNREVARQNGADALFACDQINHWNDEWYQSALESAKQKAVKVKNQDELEEWLSQKVKCNCMCHRHSGVKHVMPCCDDGWIYMPPMDENRVYSLDDSYKVEIENFCASDCCAQDGGCEYCREPLKLAIVSVVNQKINH